MKRLITAVVALATAIIFSGCSKKAETQLDKEVTIQLYYYKQENNEGLKNVVKVFENSHPNIKVEMMNTPNDDDATMQRRADVGDLPDILQIASYSRIKEYASRGLLEDLSKDQVMTKVLPSSLPAVTWNNHQYAVPMDYAGIGIIYNRDIFNKYNIEIPETFKELDAACRTLKANGVTPFAVLLKENWSIGHFITMIHTALLKNEKIDSEKFVTDMNAGKGSYGDVQTSRLFAIMDYYRSNMNEDAAQMDGAAQQKAFASGKCAMIVQGLWAYVDALKLNPNLNAGFIPFPTFNDPSMNVFYADVDSAFALSSQSSEIKRKASHIFLTWLTTEEGQHAWMTEYKLIPPFKGVNVTAFGGPYVDLMSSVEEKGSMPWAFSQYPTLVFDDACKNGAQQYMLKTRSADSVIKNIDEQWSKAVTK